MSYPGSYNFQYYKGDTLEFKVYPKDISNNEFDITDYTPQFTISTARGSSGVANKVTCVATKVTGNGILCVITPTNGASLTAGTTYVYDVEISKPGVDYDYVYTLLTGTLTVTDQITGAV